VDRRRQVRALSGCLLYGLGGLALVWALRLFVVVQQCEFALSEGRGTVALEVYDDRGAVVASRDVPVSEDGVREDRTIAVCVAAGSVAILVIAFILRGPPWRRERLAESPAP